MTSVLPFLTYSDIKSKANVFLRKYCPSRSLPIPIERIVEYDLGLDIAPFPDLYRTHRVNAWLDLARSTIFVDDYQYHHFYEKYRFTLAHEVGHYVLHSNLYESAEFRDTEEYVEWYFSLLKRDLFWLEEHADNFAGLVLVPAPELETLCQRVASEYANVFKGLRIPPEDAWFHLANEVAPFFEVNQPTVHIRIRREGIPQRILLPLDRASTD